MAQCTGNLENRLAGYQSGRPLPPPSVHKGSAVNINLMTLRSMGDTQGRGLKMKPDQETEKMDLEKETRGPFAGKLFYLDITSKAVAGKLEKDIKLLGGTVEGFLSKEISYLITSKKEAKTMRVTCPKRNPEPAPKPESSAQPSGQKECKAEGSRKKPGEDDASRGKTLLKKAMKEQQILPENSMLANAMQWGVHVLHVDDAKTFLDLKKKSMQPGTPRNSGVRPKKPRAEKLKQPYIKFEDHSGQYRPHYMMPPVFQSFQPGSYRILPLGPLPPPIQTGTHEAANKTWHGPTKRVRNVYLFTRQKEVIKRNSYCECCSVRFDDLETHRKSDRHQAFIRSSHYRIVDDFITIFDNDFVDWSMFTPQPQGLFIPPRPVRPAVTQLFSQPDITSHLPSICPPQLSTLPPPVSTMHQRPSTPVSNPVFHSEPVFRMPNPQQSLCSMLESYRLSSPKIITITRVTMSADTLALLGDNEGAKNDSHLKESDSSNVIDEPAQKGNGKIFEPFSCYHGKRLKMDNRTWSTTEETDNVSAPPPMEITEPTKDLEERCPVESPDTSGQTPHDSSLSELHRKVEPLVQEERPCCSSKVSVPLEDYVGVSKEILESVFQSTDGQSEFYGFSSSSTDCMEQE